MLKPPAVRYRDVFLVVVALVLLASTEVNAAIAENTSVQSQSESSAVKDENNARTLTLGVVVFPPFTYERQQAPTCYGPYIDRARALFARSGYQLNILCAPAARLYKLVESGEVDMTINVRTTKLLAGSVDFFEHPYSYLVLVLYRYKDAALKSVSAIRSFDYAGYRQKLQQQGYTFADVPTAEDAIDLFLRRRTDYLISYKGPFDYKLERSRVDDNTIIIEQQLSSAATFIAVSKRSKWRYEIFQWLTQQQKTLIPDSTFYDSQTTSETFLQGNP